MPEAPSSPAEAEATASLEIEGKPYDLIDIRLTGDVVLDVTFENSKGSTLAMVATPGTTSRPLPTKAPTAKKSTSTRKLYRVRLDTLKKTSKYFEHLLGSDVFKEGRDISDRFAELQTRGVQPTEANAADLPRIKITDDDEASRAVGRENVFADLLRILHGAEAIMKPTVVYLASLAIMADRFDCLPMVARYVKALKTFRWPATYGKSGKDGTTMSIATEELLRQKILISWYLDQPIRLAQCTKELIIRGSSRWIYTEDVAEASALASWWDLPDELEAELLYRRECILATLSSIETHFLSLYSSRERQCKLGYDSSASCDSYQLGEMVKFLTNKKLLRLPGFAFDGYHEPYSGDIEQLITILRQVPSYQIDTNHKHCGLRTRILPALDYIQAMLKGSIGINRAGWERDRNGNRWEEGGKTPKFEFTRDLNDPRLKVDGNMVVDRFAKRLFTAESWDWSPDEGKPSAVLGRGTWSVLKPIPDGAFR